MKTLFKKFGWLFTFALAMGLLEAAVVVYLRNIYYPEGLSFPMVSMSLDIIQVELWREVATVVMLVAIGVLAGRTSAERFGFFIFCFAVWDIFYYVFLYFFLGWPASLLEWDILFLIPLPWFGPVLAPVIVSLNMIGLSVITSYFVQKRVKAGFKWGEISLMIVGCLVIIGSFIADYYLYLLEVKANTPHFSMNDETVIQQMANFIPQQYNWWLFLIGEAFILLGITYYTKRLKNELRKQIA